MNEKRVLSLDLLRGLMLIYMVFVNAFYALSKEQPWLLSHDGRLMAPGDLIVIYFFFSIGFNLSLVKHFRFSENRDLLKYALTRGILIMVIGIILNGYTFFIVGFMPILLFRSFLFVLGIAMVATGLFIVLMPTNMRFLMVFFLIFATVLLLFNPRLPAGFRFLNPFLLLTSLLGYFIGNRYLYLRGSYFRLLYAGIPIMLFIGFLSFFIYGQFPSRKVMNPSYFFISWASILFLIGLFQKYQELTVEMFPAWIIRLGQHPLSFWIIQSLLIAVAVTAVSFAALIQMGSFSWTLNIPILTRSVEPLWLSVVCSAIVSISAVSMTFLFTGIINRLKSSLKS